MKWKKPVFTQPSIKRCGHMRHDSVKWLTKLQSRHQTNGGQPFHSKSAFFTISNLLGYKRTENSDALHPSRLSDLSDFSSHPNLTSASRFSAKNDLQDSYRQREREPSSCFFSNGSESFLFFFFFTWPGHRWMISLVKEFSVYIRP